MQWNRLVCGVNNDKIQRRLLGVTDTKLDFKKPIELTVRLQRRLLASCRTGQGQELVHHHRKAKTRSKQGGHACGLLSVWETWPQVHILSIQDRSLS